ncbi:hypothetical protein CK203_060841 [Vitis vinifera]|uniref:Uncharacterized protein n=1 Tax=Vitis vinifera TaxID=29760 RepID=A0A438FUA4_VITVI|nr:hypothetical protein CK203_060841 [Vitis vinifera]
MEVGSCDHGLCGRIAKNSSKLVRFEFARKDATYEEGLREILDKKVQVLRTKIIPLVKVLWDHHGVEGEDEKQVPRTLYSHVAYHLLLGCIESPIKGLVAPFAPFYLQPLRLERGSRERNYRFEVKITYIEEPQKESPCKALSFDILFMWTVGPWVKVPKAFEEDTPMWVYGVGRAPGF